MRIILEPTEKVSMTMTMTVNGEIIKGTAYHLGRLRAAIVFALLLGNPQGLRRTIAMGGLWLYCLRVLSDLDCINSRTY